MESGKARGSSFSGVASGTIEGRVGAVGNAIVLVTVLCLMMQHVVFVSRFDEVFEKGYMEKMRLKVGVSHLISVPNGWELCLLSSLGCFTTNQMKTGGFLA